MKKLFDFPDNWKLVSIDHELSDNLNPQEKWYTGTAEINQKIFQFSGYERWNSSGYICGSYWQRSDPE